MAGFESVAGGEGEWGYEMGWACMEGRKTYERVWLKMGTNGSRVSNTPSGLGIVKAETRHADSSDSVRGKGEAKNILSVPGMGSRIQLARRALPILLSRPRTTASVLHPGAQRDSFVVLNV